MFGRIQSIKIDHRLDEVHCEMCGASGDRLGIWDGYTCCCNELTCDGSGFHLYEHDDGKVYCCFGSFEIFELRRKYGQV